MNLINKKLLDKFDEFVKSLKNTDRIAVYHDSDPDGTCSAVIVSKAIEQLTGKKITAHVGRPKGQHYLSTETAQKLQEMNINKIITVDLATDEKPEGIIAAQKYAQVLVTDHHKLYNDLNKNNSQNCIMLKPQLLYDDIDPQLYCNSKFVYDLFSRHANLNEIDWMAAVGIIADVASKQWPTFLEQTFKKYKIPIITDFFKSKLGKVAHVISSAQVYDDKNVPLCFEVLYGAKQPKDVLNSELKQFTEAIEKEIRHYTTNIKKLAEFYDNIGLVFYYLNPKYAITSPLSTIIGFKYPDKTVLILSKNEGRMHVSARRQDKKIAVNNLLEKAVEGFENANAGGHVAAAGATFSANQLQLFKTRILKLLTEVSS